MGHPYAIIKSHRLGLVQLGCLILVFVFSSCTSPKPNLFSSLKDQKKVVIVLSDYNLKDVPPDVKALTNATTLIIRRKQGGWTMYPPIGMPQHGDGDTTEIRLPKELTTLTALEKLDLSDLGLRRLPEDFENLANLDSLFLDDNYLIIADQVETLGKLKRLRYLKLWGNLMTQEDIENLNTALPKANISFFPSLESFYNR